MKFRLELVSTVNRGRWFVETLKNPGDEIYMGDGIFDSYVFPVVGYAIAPSNAASLTKDRAVAEASPHILDRFFEPFDPDRPPREFAGKWTV